MNKETLRDILFGLIGALSLLGGVMAADVLFDDGSVSLPAASVSYVAPHGTEAAEGDPGGLVAPVAVPAPEPLFPGAAVVYPTVIDSDGQPYLDIPDGTSGSQGDDSTGGGSAGNGSEQGTDQQSDGQAASPQGAGGTVLAPSALETAGTEMATIVRFLDLCADTSSPACPAGIGAVVLFEGSPAPPPPLKIEVLVDATAALYPGLRCDPGWPTQDVVPVALVSNRPLSLANVSLQLKTNPSSVVALHEVNGLKSAPTEHALYEQRVKAAQPTGTTIGTGFHTCLQLRFDTSANTTPFSRKTEFDQNSWFEIHVVGFHKTDGTTRTVKFINQYTAKKRPPVRVKPLDGNRASVWVPQTPADTPFVWVVPAAASTGCNAGPGTDGQARLNSATAAPQPIPPNALNDPTYPWDRTFDHYTVWDLELRASSIYTMCVQWKKEGRLEVWSLETPDGLSISLRSGWRHWRDNKYAGPARIMVVGMPGCSVLAEDSFQAFECRSVGTSIGADLEFRGLLPGGNEPYGIVSVSKSNLVSRCADGAGSDGRYPCKFRLEWRSRQTLCGGSVLFPPTNCGDLLLEYEIHLEVKRLTTNGRSDPLDWGINLLSTVGGASP